jgi:predicted DNA-binding transcriptional regulator AlpA
MNLKSSNPAEVGVNAHAEAPPLHQSKTLEAQPWVRLDFSRAKWYTLMYRNGAPKPIKFGRSARWVPSEVDAWVNQALKNGGAK